jgi:hypothetical protein
VVFQSETLAKKARAQGRTLQDVVLGHRSLYGWVLGFPVRVRGCGHYIT